MKKIAVINDISGFGRCSLTAAIPVISALGAECCPVPTAVLSNQTGYPSYFCADCTDWLEPYLDEWDKLGVSFDAVLTGYLASEKQAAAVAGALERFRKQGAFVAVDPVMADDGEMYSTYNTELCERVSKLALEADLITPNLTELCIICKEDYSELVKSADSDLYFKKIADMARGILSPRLKAVIVTGVRQGQNIHNLAVTQKETFNYSVEAVGGSYSGTGDIFSSAVCAMLINGKNLERSVKVAADFIALSIADTYKEKTDRNDGVNFQKFLGVLTDEQKQN